MTAMHIDELADRINSVSRLTGTFTLRSGQIASEYFDKYRFEAQPALLAEIATAMAPLIPEGTEVLAGLEMGGIPIATALSMHTGIPAAFVRKEAKTYGTAQLAEGTPVVLSDRAALPELLAESCGYTFIPGDPADLARQLGAVLDADDAERRQMAEATRARHREHFSPEAVRSLWLGAYEGVIADAG
jgi:orotate phosphoribosyltransferase